jgi:hypothetical protein
LKPRKTRNVAKRKGSLSRALAFFAVQNNGLFFITAKDAKGAKDESSEGCCFSNFIFLFFASFAPFAVNLMVRFIETAKNAKCREKEGIAFACFGVFRGSK